MAKRLSQIIVKILNDFLIRHRNIKIFIFAVESTMSEDVVPFSSPLVPQITSNTHSPSLFSHMRQSQTS